MPMVTKVKRAAKLSLPVIGSRQMDVKSVEAVDVINRGGKVHDSSFLLQVLPFYKAVKEKPAGIARLF